MSRASFITMYVAINIHRVINNNRTGTNNGGKKAVSYAHVVYIYSNLLRVVYINNDISYVTKQNKDARDVNATPLYISHLRYLLYSSHGVMLRSL